MVAVFSVRALLVIICKQPANVFSHSHNVDLMRRLVLSILYQKYVELTAIHLCLHVLMHNIMFKKSIIMCLPSLLDQGCIFSGFFKQELSCPIE